MSVAETWPAPAESAPGAEAQAGVRIVIVDGTDDDARCLLQAARGAGIECPWRHWSEGSRGPSALLFETQGLSEALGCLRALRTDAQLARLPALLSIHPAQLPQLPALGGFDDFVLQPCSALEVRARIRIIDQRRRARLAPAAPAEAESSFDLDEDGMHVDPVSHEALVAGCTIRLTAREFALFAYLRARPGRVFSRQHLLERVWGHRYQGGPRTVDTHVGRLRLKFGDALAIETVRAGGYRLRQGGLAASEPRCAQELPVHESAAE